MKIENSFWTDDAKSLADLENICNKTIETIDSSVGHLKHCASFRAERARDAHVTTNPTTPVKDNRHIYGSPPFYSDEQFFGRTEILSRIDAALQPEQASERRCYTIYGLGGVGKSKISLAYATRYREQYSVVMWIRGETKLSLSQSFSNIAVELGLLEHNNHEDTHAAKDAVHKWLNKNGKSAIR